ncbi:MAG: hypothetical protein GXO70_01190 [Acidobacteria bacterium]|nr:hypothetical protein [Acidobacteriota bacterium]
MKQKNECLLMRRVRGFHKSEGGQSIVFVVLTLLFVVLFVFMVINTGDVTSKKMRMVTAADAVAVSGATWMARGHNSIAMMNVAQSQILAIIILLRSVDMTYDIANGIFIALGLVAKVLSAIPFTAAAGAALEVYVDIGQNVINKPLHEVMTEIKKILDKDGDGLLWKLEKALTTGETIVVDVIPFIAQIESIRIGIANEATFGFLYPMIPMFDLKLPFIGDDDRQFKTLCKPTHNAMLEVPGHGDQKVQHLPTTHYVGVKGKLGAIVSGILTGQINYGDAPLDYFKAFMPYPALRIVYPMIGLTYDLVVEATYQSMCLGKVGTVEYEQSSDKCSECYSKRDKLKKATFVTTVIKTRRSKSEAESMDLGNVIDFHRCDGPGEDSRCEPRGTYKTQSGEETIYGYDTVKHPGLDKMIYGEGDSTPLTGNSARWKLESLGSDCKKRSVSCYMTKNESGLYDGSAQAPYQYDKNHKVIAVRICKIIETKLASCSYSDSKKTTPEQAWGGTGDDKKPKPYLLKRDKEGGKEYWEKHEDFVGIVYLKPKPHVLSGNYLKNPNPIGMIYFSQAKVYVAGHADAHLFNQCWRVRLVKFDKLSDITSGVNGSSMNNMSNTAGEGPSGGSSGGFLGALSSLGGMSDKFIIH